MFPPRVDWDNIDWQSRRPLMDFPVQVLTTQETEGLVIMQMLHFHIWLCPIHNEYFESEIFS